MEESILEEEFEKLEDDFLLDDEEGEYEEGYDGNEEDYDEDLDEEDF